MRKTTLLAAVLSLSLSVWAEPHFKTPQEAVSALNQAVTSDSDEAMQAVFGTISPELVDPAPEARQENRRLLRLLLKERWKLSPLGEGRQLLRLGREGWPFPVPLVKSSEGWAFDTQEGAEEIKNRRIGRNELIAVETCVRIADAQEDYRGQDRDGDGVREYATTVVSSPGKQDGLYWEVQPREIPSPLQKALKQAWNLAAGRVPGSPWFGYRFRFLPGQASSAPGGARDYTMNGNQIAGWALLAYPSVYGSTGVMSFQCSQDGIVYEKDLGADTAQQAQAITLFDPGQGWQRVQPQDLPEN